MKVFSDFEKKVIRKLCSESGFERYLFSILDDDLVHVTIRVDSVGRTVDINFPIEDEEQDDIGASSMIQEIERLLMLFMDYAVLLEYLERERLIFLFNPATKKEKAFVSGQATSTSGSKVFPIADEGLVNAILRFSFGMIIPSPGLKDLLKNDFRTTDERRFRKQMIATWAAIIVAFATGAWGNLRSGYESNSTGRSSELGKETVAELKAINKKMTQLRGVSKGEISEIAEAIKSLDQNCTCALKSQRNDDEEP